MTLSNPAKFGEGVVPATPSPSGFHQSLSRDVRETGWEDWEGQWRGGQGGRGGGRGRGRVSQSRSRRLHDEFFYSGRDERGITGPGIQSKLRGNLILRGQLKKVTTLN